MTDPFETARNASAGMPGHSMSADVGVREAGGDKLREALVALVSAHQSQCAHVEFHAGYEQAINDALNVADWFAALNAPTESVKAPEGVTDLRTTVAKVINEMSRQMPYATEDWRAQLTEALA